MSRFPTGRSISAAAVIATSVSLVVSAGPASAKTVTLHFFQKLTSSRYYAPDGKPVGPPGPTNPPAVGERLNSTDSDYVGDHRHHAKRFSATDRLACTFVTASGLATCDGEIAIDGSMLLADDATLNLGQGGPIRTPLTGGTGIYQHAHGTSVSTGVPNTKDADFTLTFTF
jgi:hypothetical protein